MSENDSVLVSHFGSDDVSKFQPAEASYQIHEAWEESGSPGSEGRFGVFAVSSLFADSFSFWWETLFSPRFFFVLFWGGLELWWSECAGCATTSICGSKDVGFMVNWSQEPCHLWWMPSWCGDSFGLLEYSPGQAARFLQETNRFHRFHSCFRVHRRTFSSQKRVELTTWGFSTS